MDEPIIVPMMRSQHGPINPKYVNVKGTCDNNVAVLGWPCMMMNCTCEKQGCFVYPNLLRNYGYIR